MERRQKISLCVLWFTLQNPFQNVPIEAANIDLHSLRSAAVAAADPERVGVKEAIRNVYTRSKAVRCYALRRASGKCESCDSAAPFKDISGLPFLEVHHIDRLADNGPERVDRVAAICPNCHRRCHYAHDYRQYNSALRTKIAALEQNIITEWAKHLERENANRTGY